MTADDLMRLIGRYTEACDDLGAGLFEQTAAETDAKHGKATFLHGQILTEAHRLHAEVENLRAALQWYADGLHFDKASPDEWDTVSGEPQNWWCDESGTATVEDGSIAKMTLAGELTAAQIQALDDDQAWDRNAERITREVMGADVDRPINPHATSVDDL